MHTPQPAEEVVFRMNSRIRPVVSRSRKREESRNRGLLNFSWFKTIPILYLLLLRVGLEVCLFFGGGCTLPPPPSCAAAACFLLLLCCCCLLLLLAAAAAFTNVAYHANLIAG
jgi:hypothetical protein